MSKDIATIISNLATPDEIEVYEVVEKHLYTGMRIEGFSIGTYMFTDETKALQHAYKIYRDYLKNHGDEKKGSKAKYNDLGDYRVPGSGGYEDWPDLDISVRVKKLRLNEDIIFTSDHGD